METIVKLFDSRSTTNLKHIKFNGELALPSNGKDRAQYYLDFMYGSIFARQATTTELCSQYREILDAVITENQLGHVMYVIPIRHL